MAASGRRGGEGGVESWVGPGLPMTAPTGIQVVIAPRLLDILRRHVATIGSMSDAERAELRAVLARVVRAVSMKSADILGPQERADIDDLLRKAGLPPLDTG